MQVITFGCRLNMFESAVMQQIVGARLDDVIVVNTCAVTSEAERQCRQSIRQLAHQHPDCKIIVTGCAAQLHPDVFVAMPEVYRVLGNREKVCESALLGTNRVSVGDLSGQPPELPVLTDFEGRTRAFLQIQQGCDHACTFCIVHKIRGRHFALTPEYVLKQARAFVEHGFSEIVLTGVDVASYPDLWGLTKRLVTEVDGLKRLRFGSLDPAKAGHELIDLMAKYPALMPSVHLSVQAGDDLILKRMGRRHTFNDVLTFARELRKMNALATIGADFIAGFPTETEEQFGRTLDLIESADITHAHVFPYSVREGTPAAKMPMVDKSVRVSRAERARLLSQKIQNKWLDKMVGNKVSVLVEQHNLGYTENYLPVRVGESASAGEIVTGIVRGKENNELVI